MGTITVTEARAALPEVLDRVDRGEEVTLTRHGRPVAVLVRPDALRGRRAGQAFEIAEQTRAALAAGRRRPLPTEPVLSAQRADELVDGIRRDRAERA